MQRVAAKLDTVLLLLSLALASAAAGPAGPDGEDGPGATFRAAVEAAPWSGEQVRLLERVAKEGPATRWGDDALWLLGEMARKAGDQRRAVYYWQYLVALRPDVMLEEETQSLDAYANSGIPQVELYLALTARQYVQVPAAGVRGGRSYFGVRPVNSTAMLVWAGLGQAYESLDRPQLALRAYRQALVCCPGTGTWRKRYEEAVERLEGETAPAPAAASAARASGEESLPGPAAAVAREESADGQSAETPLL